MIKTIAVVGVLLMSLLWCSISVPHDRSAYATASARKPPNIHIPSGISESLWRRRIPNENPMSSRKVALGRALFFDKRLSADRTISCATCHDPARAFTDGNRLAVGVRAKEGTRNTPTILNAIFAEALFWDGRVSSLEEQVTHPLMSSFEMGMSSKEELVARVASRPEYRRQFKQVFNSPEIDVDTIAKAIASYERTLLSGNSPFDRFTNGDATGITASQQRGWELFKGKARCLECHTYSSSAPFFTDFKFHNTGVAATDSLLNALSESLSSSKDSPLSLAHATGFSELGRFTITLARDDVGAFKTPTLRDVELTSPYMHDGSLKTLIDVVQFYNRGGGPNAQLDARISPLKLTPAEVNDLVEFMRSLTSADVLRECQTTTPQDRTPAREK